MVCAFTEFAPLREVVYSAFLDVGLAEDTPRAGKLLLDRVSQTNFLDSLVECRKGRSPGASQKVSNVGKWLPLRRRDHFYDSRLHSVFVDSGDELLKI